MPADMPIGCLLVDGTPYDDIITNFECYAGYYNTLNVNKFRDGRHVLDEIVERTEAAGTQEEEITVGPGRIRCGENSSISCNVVNGAAFRSEIVDFQPCTVTATACAWNDSACFPAA